MSIVSSRKARLQQRVYAGSRGAKAALELADDPGQFLSTAQVGAKCTDDAPVSEEEIRVMLQQGAGAGVFTKPEHTMSTSPGREQ